MVTLDYDVTRRDGVTFVTALVRNTQTTPQTVRLESRLEGPVWPPRRDGITTPEWDGKTWNGTIKPGRTRGIGFASPAQPTEPPLERCDERRCRRSGNESATPAETLATLEGWAPPTDVLPPAP
ncbi:hypothetical protein SAMN04487967_2899 [Natronorubrum sediminis]|uniref:Uncharacterized protein n=1 Tax=Natronorubrum sediminis TaxID=640943 RepID=A0A1H6G2Y8_9EURY|nr:hypothetical protein [Natronorubrum sediminis]SEH16980.1 hypothetical protein SAMN04487967_2899 [Natronorubrum sediminis]